MNIELLASGKPAADKGGGRPGMMSRKNNCSNPKHAADVKRRKVTQSFLIRALPIVFYLHFSTSVLRNSRNRRESNAAVGPGGLFQKVNGSTRLAIAVYD